MKCPRLPTRCAGTRFLFLPSQPILSRALSHWAAMATLPCKMAWPFISTSPMLHARALLLQRRRRNADPAAAGTASLAHRTRHPRCRSRRARRDSARHQVPRRVARRPRPAAISAKTTASPSACPSSAPSAPMGWRTRATSLPPVAAYEDREGAFEVISKFLGRLWRAEIDHSPLDVVAWHGNYAPYKYDMARFNCINTVSFDHPDPSIFTVLTAPSPARHGERGFRHLPAALDGRRAHLPPAVVPSQPDERVHGPDPRPYDAKAEGFLPGGASLHNCMSGHGPDAETFERASEAELKPHYIDGTLAFMFETRLPVRPTRFALESKILQHEYYECWQSLKKNFPSRRSFPMCARVSWVPQVSLLRLGKREPDELKEPRRHDGSVLNFRLVAHELGRIGQRSRLRLSARQPAVVHLFR